MLYRLFKVWLNYKNAIRNVLFVKWGDGEGAPIHMPMIRLESVENHSMYRPMPSDNLRPSLEKPPIHRIF